MRARRGVRAPAKLAQRHDRRVVRREPRRHAPRAHLAVQLKHRLPLSSVGARGDGVRVPASTDGAEAPHTPALDRFKEGPPRRGRSGGAVL
eukprot:2200428-Prymnesium_polylepis.1